MSACKEKCQHKNHSNHEPVAFKKYGLTHHITTTTNQQPQPSTTAIIVQPTCVYRSIGDQDPSHNFGYVLDCIGNDWESDMCQCNTLSLA